MSDVTEQDVRDDVQEGAEVDGAGVRWLSEEEQEAWRSTIYATNLLLARLGDVLEHDPEIDLTLPEYEMLVKLSEAEEHTLVMSELARRVVHSRSRTAHTVARLEKRGYVRRADASEFPACGDRRCRFAILQPAGYEALRRAAPRHVESVRSFLVDALGSEDFLRLGGLLRRTLPVLDPDHDVIG